MTILTAKEKQVKQFFDSLDRRDFIPEAVWSSAHWDLPLPIGFGQTISQPSLVLEMTNLLDLEVDHDVLEIGTGSGYQTAFLAEFSACVYTIERFETLSISAQESLRRLGYENIHFLVGDGSEGWPQAAPFDRIIVTAAAAKLPENLIEQLKPGGKMVIPLGPRDMQHLVLVKKGEDGTLAKEIGMAVRFVEFVGEYGWEQN